MNDITEILEDFELTGQQLVLQSLEEDQEAKTDSGIILAGKSAEGLKIAKVLKAGKGLYDFGKWVENPIKVNAIVYYNNAVEHEIDGTKFLTAQTGQIIAYKNV